ncbi:DUF1656 domain-containing protein [Sphingobium cloacae]|uniref:DUF1656 domain-containing protein n=1 Tax=Sphingobium cloacae TaxID=120107 RepID=UPI00082EFFEC|nr:DUF1656 domain-containing protein [Sphingobium cloacae]
MTGEVALGGVYVPTLLLLAVFALILNWGVTRLIHGFGLYRFIAYRALVDLSIFILLLGLLSVLFPLFGIRL